MQTSMEVYINLHRKIYKLKHRIEIRNKSYAITIKKSKKTYTGFHFICLFLLTQLSKLFNKKR